MHRLLSTLPRALLGGAATRADLLTKLTHLSPVSLSAVWNSNACFCFCACWKSNMLQTILNGMSQLVAHFHSFCFIYKCISYF
jgi:hypothetical protein